MSINSIKPLSHHVTSEKVFELITKNDIRNASILDVGAGEGYFSKSLGDYIEREYTSEPSSILKACDLYPEQFKYQKIICDKVDVNYQLPYQDDTFDCVVSIECVEHIENQFAFVRELSRVVKKDGRVIITTPNILNINSRIKYFHSGFWLLFDPLMISSSEPIHLMGHINPNTLYYLSYMFSKLNFKEVNIHYDRF